MTGQFADVTAADAPFEIVSAGVQQVRDGKLAEIWLLKDLAAIRLQLGAPGWPSADPGLAAGTQGRGTVDTEASRRTVLRWTPTAP